MAQVQAPAGGAPTGNALSDANLVTIGTAGVQIDPAAAAASINQTNQQIAQVASDCLWPPSGQITVPIIPGIWHQSVHIPCLLTYSEARAAVGAGVLIGGLLIFGVGVQIFAVAAAIGLVSSITGAVLGGSSTVSKARAVPAAVTAAVAA